MARLVRAAVMLSVIAFTPSIAVADPVEGMDTGADLTGPGSSDGEVKPEVEAVTSPAPTAPEDADLTVGSSRVQSFLSPRARCIIQHESNWDPYAVNPRSKASGLGQFLASTWKTTPAGKAGISVFNADANARMVQWMLDVGRGREFATLSLC